MVSDLLAGVTELTKAQREYKTAEQYYLGTRPEFFSSQRYRYKLQQTGTTYRMNFAKIPVNAVCNRLTIAAVTITDDAPNTQILNSIMSANQMDIEEREIHRRACEFGDAYVLVWPNDDIDEELEDLENDDVTEAGGVEMYYNDPRTMRLFYDKENPRKKSYAIKMWDDDTDDAGYAIYLTGSVVNASNQPLPSEVGPTPAPSGKKPIKRVNLYYKDRIEKYACPANRKGDRDQDWERFDDGTGEWPTPNPYNFIPIFHFRTDRPYGIPAHIDAYGAQDAITKIVINHMVTMDYHGYPQRYALSGGDLDEGETDMEDVGFDDDTQSNSQEVSRNRTNVHAEPGHIWFLKNIKTVGQFAAADASTFVTPFGTYVRAMSQLTDTPLHYFDPIGNVPSGEALRVAEVPIVKRTEDIQALFSATWSDLYESALKIAGVTVKPGSVVIEWDSPQAQNDQLTWDLVTLKLAAGIPVWQVFVEAGYSPRQLKEWGVPQAKYVFAQQQAPNQLTLGKPQMRLPTTGQFADVTPAVEPPTGTKPPPIPSPYSPAGRIG